MIKNKNIQLVAPSNWIKEKALKSFGDFIPKVITIPNPIPDIFFEEYEKSRARKNLNLPKDKINADITKATNEIKSDSFKAKMEADLALAAEERKKLFADPLNYKPITVQSE